MVYNIQTNIIVSKIISSKSSNMFLYLTNDWSQISKSGWRIIVSDLWWQINEFPIALIEGIVIIGRIQLSTDVIRVCLKSHIPVFFLSKKWSYFGKLDSMDAINTDLLYNHIQASVNPQTCLSYAQAFVMSKIQNSRTMLIKWKRYNQTKDPIIVIDQLQRSYRMARRCNSLETLRWVEWYASKIYFSWWSKCVWPDRMWNARNKRPPRDPLNSMLSLWYTLLWQTINMVLDMYGIFGQIWFYHQPKDLKTLLVYDVMEMFRAWIVDNMVINLTQSGKILWSNFSYADNGACIIDNAWLKILISEYYQSVFRDIYNPKRSAKIQMIQRNIEEFKKSLLQKWEYTGFRIT